MDSHLAACCGSSVTVWNPQASSADNVVLNIKGTAACNTVVWMSNAKVLATGGDEGVVRFYATKGGNNGPVATCPKERDVKASRNAITAISSNQAGNNMAYGSRTGDLLVASLASLEVRSVHQGVGGAITSIATTRGQHVAASSSNGKVFVLSDLKEGSTLAELQCKDTQAKCSLSASLVDDKLACGSHAGGICIWDSASGWVRNHVQHQESGAVQVAFLPASADTLIAAGSDRRCKVWDIRNEGKCGLAFSVLRPATGVTCCGDGRHVAIGDEEGIVWVYDLRATAVAQLRLPCGGNAPVGHVTWFVKGAAAAAQARESAGRASTPSHSSSSASASHADDSARISSGRTPENHVQPLKEGSAKAPSSASPSRSAAFGGAPASGSDWIPPSPPVRQQGMAGMPSHIPSMAAINSTSTAAVQTIPADVTAVAAVPVPSIDMLPTPAINTHQIKQHIDGALEQMKDAITNLHLDLLRQFQAQQEDLLTVTSHLTERIDALAADVKGVRSLLDARNKHEQAANWI